MTDEIATLEEALERIEGLREEMNTLDAQIIIADQALKLARTMRHRLANEMQKLILWVQRYERRRAAASTTLIPSGDLEGPEVAEFPAPSVPILDPQDPG